jgi:hypothetical protein
MRQAAVGHQPTRPRRAHATARWVENLDREWRPIWPWRLPAGQVEHAVPQTLALGSGLRGKSGLTPCPPIL